MRLNHRIAAAAALASGLGLAMPVRAQTVPQNLTTRTIEELMNVEVTSVSKKEQTLARTAAAVYVIGQEEIRRSGATNIPDLLRMAPGVEVAQIDGNHWAISVRGFNSYYSNKVLVLVDGRSVYVTTFSGVYWDQLDVPLENIDRIEVIRGPGGTVWGANAVNGVINIITKSAADTKGGLVAIGGGSQGANQDLAQYGGHAGSNGAYRIFGKYSTVDSSRFPGGLRAADGWRREHAGFRADWRLSDADTFSLQGDLVSGNSGATRNVILNGASLFQATLNIPENDLSLDGLVRWDRTLAHGSTSLQVYESSTRRDEAGSRIAFDVVDVDFSHHLAAGSRHDIVWGLGFRSDHDQIVPLARYSLQLTPASRTLALFSAFAQDEIRITPAVSLTLGSKIEHNDFTGFDYEPSAQLTWTNDARRTLWLSAGRAVRQPDRTEFSGQYDLALAPVPGAGNAVLRVLGNPNFDRERLYDFEGGYRTQVTKRISLDVTTFLHLYRGLETNEPGLPYVTVEDGAPVLILPLTFGNLAHARNHGLEAFGTWNVTRRWSVSPGYSWLRMNVGTNPSSRDTTVALEPGDSPSQQFQIRSNYTLRRNVEWSGSFKYVTALSSLGVPGYGRLDTRLAWHPLEAMELSIVGQNLNSRSHIEFLDNSGLSLRTAVARSVLGKVVWRF